MKSVRYSRYTGEDLGIDAEELLKAVAIATIITINSGTAAALVQSPNNTRRPHAISKVPTKCAVKYGCAKPILAKRTTPMLGSMYLRMPCVEKMSPTARRMSRIVAGPCVGINKNRRPAFADSVIDISYREWISSGISFLALRRFRVYTRLSPVGPSRIEPCIMLPGGRPSSHLRCNPTQEQERGGINWDRRRGGSTCGSFMDATARPKARPREGCWMNSV